MRDVKQQSVRDLIDMHLAEGDAFEDIIDRFRNTVIVHALAKCHGNISHAATLLKTHRNSIQRWMNKFHIDSEEFREDPAGTEEVRAEN